MFSKYYLLKHLAKIPCLFTCFVLFVMFSGYMSIYATILILDIAIVIALFSDIVKWILRTDYDFYCIIIKNKYAVNEVSIEDYLGYNLVSNANKTVHRLFLFVTFFILILCSFLKLISGWQWVIFYVTYLIVFVIDIKANSMYYPTDKIIKIGRRELNEQN